MSPSEDLGPAGRAEREAGPPEPERIAPEGPDPDRIAPDRPDPGRIAPEVSRRVNSILDAVEREAESIRERAKEDARRYIEYSRRRADGLVAERQRVIAALSDELVGRAERVLKRLDDVEPVRAAFDGLLKSLGEMAERLDREAGDYSEFVPPAFEHSQPGTAPSPPSQRSPWPPTPESPPPRSEAPAETSGAAPGRRSGLADQDWRNLDGAQVIAIQMAAAGSTRGEVETHLRDSLGVAEPATVLDDVFGAGSAGDARVPWARPAG